MLDEVGGDHGEPGGGAADLEWAAADPSGDDPAHGGGDEAGLEGAPVARAMPRERGRAIRKTAIAAETSAPATRKRRGPWGGGLWGGWTCLVRAESARAGTQADMFPSPEYPFDYSE